MTTPRADDQDVARIEKAVAAVRAWSSRYSNDPLVPQPGSLMAKDDRVYPALPLSSVTWFAITSALDHLDLGADMLQADGVRVLRPHAFYSLTRSALLGAAQALWLLTGNDEQRAIRSLLIVEDEATLQRKHLRADLQDETLAADVSAEFPEKLAELDTKLTGRIDDARALLRARGHKERFQSTAMIADIAKFAAPNDRWLRRAIMDQWMRGSAAAHSRMWVMHVVKTEDEPAPGGGVIRRMTSSVSDIAQAYGAPTLLLSQALELWHARSARRASPLITTPLPHVRPPVH